MIDQRVSALVADALASITDQQLSDAVLGVTAIASPTGSEAPLARWLADRLTDAGLDGQVQSLDANQANAVARLRGRGGGSDVMLYAPIDTLTTGVAERDLPWIGPALRPDMVAQPRREGDLITGLGASNPKGHAACILVAAQALAPLRPVLAGDVVFAFGAGGMPTNSLEESRANTGHGVGCSFLLERGWYTDYAVIAKPGDFVAFDEVGLCWFEIEVPGIHTYSGSRHRLPYRNPIVVAADVVQRLEAWLADYPQRHRTATAAPQGIIGSIAGGWERMVAVTPAACRIRLDMRVAPGTTPQECRRELLTAVARIGAELDVALRADLVLAVPSTATAPDNWIVESTIRAWEQANGRPHQPIADNSGATDANILRARGIPTARVGMPKVAIDGIDFTGGMNTVDIVAMRRLCEVLITVAVETSLHAPTATT